VKVSEETKSISYKFTIKNDNSHNISPWRNYLGRNVSSPDDLITAVHREAHPQKLKEKT